MKLARSLSGAFAALACVHCGGGIADSSPAPGRYHSSDGQVMAYDLRIPGSAEGAGDRALRASGAYDLDCPADALTLTWLIHGHELVDGCGKRAAYVEGDPNRHPEEIWGSNVKFYLVGIVPLKPQRALAQ
jgi:hypothetical protein